MGNMFRCTLKSGGASGTGIPLIVTCSVNFAGKTITATDGTTTLTQTCPSTSPYTVQFDLPNTGSWTISGVIEGQTYSETISVTEYQLALNSGFDYETWVSLGGLDPDDYASLSAVFADEEAVRRLMLVHASADYLIAKVSNDVTVIDDFCANDTAMKWLGLCDYVCDGLTAITGVEAKLLASTYWERYLKDHVPTMTSDTAPYGTVTASSQASGKLRYYAFDGDTSTSWADNLTASGDVYIQYAFTSPTCVKRAYLYIDSGSISRISAVKIVGSNDNANWSDILNSDTTPYSDGHYYELENNTHYLYYRALFTKVNNNYTNVSTLQFYGRALNVSVPVMTSDTAPYGNVSASSEFNSTSYAAYRVFDGNETSTNQYWSSTAGSITNQWIRYNFLMPVSVKKLFIIGRNHAADPKNCKLQYSYNGNDWEDAASFVNTQSSARNYQDTPNDIYALYWRVLFIDNYGDSQYMYVQEMQFYGVDYSEKEFEAGTTRKWLYDHGVELQVFTGYTSSANATAEKQADNLYLAKTNANSTNASFTAEQNDFTDYDLAFVITGDISYPQSLSSGSKSILITTGELPTAAETTLAAIGLFNKLNYLDISSVDQTAYLRLLVSNGSSGGTAMGMDIEEVWVE